MRWSKAYDGIRQSLGSKFHRPHNQHPNAHTEEELCAIKNSFGALCAQLNITHKLIRPRTPWHNGKVERSHRSDQERFYNHLRFYSYDDLQNQMKHYLQRSNQIPMPVLGWMSPVQKREALKAARFC